MKIKTGLLALALVTLLTGCVGSGETAAEETLPVGTTDSQEVKVTRGIVSEGTLFVELDKQVVVHCQIDYEVLQEGVTEREAGLLVETFQMELQDQMDGLTTYAAWADTMEDEVAGMVEKIEADLNSDDFAVTAEILEIQRIVDP